MKELILYSSITGNTKKLADAIHEELPHVAFMKTQDFIEDRIHDYDIFYIGYWVDKGNVDPVTQKVLQMMKDKIIVFFGTLGAGENTGYYSMVKQRVESNAMDNQIIGHFLCQGAVNDAVIQRYQKMIIDHPDDEHMKQQLENYEKGKSHPDEQDLINVKEFIKNLSIDSI